ncbi:MAG: hypothetical protein ACK49E_27255, partial [Planctomyces sp.]
MAGLRPGTTAGIPPETAAHQWKVANADDPLLFIRETPYSSVFIRGSKIIPHRRSSVAQHSSFQG